MRNAKRLSPSAAATAATVPAATPALTAAKGGKAAPASPADEPTPAPVSQVEQPAAEVQPETPATAPVVEQPAAAETTSAPAEQPAPKAPLSIAEVMERADKVNRVLERAGHIRKQAENLDAFQLGSPEMRDSLVLADGFGRKFETTKSELIQRVWVVIREAVKDGEEKAANELRELMNA